MLDEGTRQVREKIVLDHMRDERRRDWDDVLATFPHPRYELIGAMTVHDGDSEVRDYYRESRIRFPDQSNELISLRHSDDAVIVEFWLTGTHRGPLGKIPATGSRFRVRMTAYFIFDEQTLVCERVYYDRLTMIRQFFDGLNMKQPANWLLAARFARGVLSISNAEPDPALLDTTAPTTIA